MAKNTIKLSHRQVYIPAGVKSVGAIFPPDIDIRKPLDLLLATLADCYGREARLIVFCV